MGELCDTLAFVGTGRDGDLIVTQALDLGTFNHEGRSCSDGGDAVAYSVVEFVDALSARVSPTPSEGCLSAGDELLAINLQGTSGSTVNVGRSEYLEVKSVSADVVQFARPKLGYFGDSSDADDNIGLARTQQRVMLQRVPHYKSLILPADQLLTAPAWNGVRGGVLALRVQERFVAAGRIDMAGRGFVGGAATESTGTSGEAGESPAGLGARGRNANGGGGGGGAGDYSCDTFGFSGGGGGHVSDGDAGSSWCSGFAGMAYANAPELRFGSGGGSGGTDNLLSDNPAGGRGGAGGGVILLFARELYVYGPIDVSGAKGQGDANECTDATSASSCWDYSGPGGGGAGGYVALEAATLTLGNRYVRARAGAGGNGVDNFAGNGGAGSVGRVLVTTYESAPSGDTDPEATLTVR
jgi:hypothetical protein